jgi:mannose-1-phosphate guanylyltransferase
VVTLDVPRDQVQSYGVVVADEKGRVRSFQEKPRPEDALSTAASTGIYIFEPAVLSLVPSGCPFDIGSELFPLLVERNLPFFAQKRFFNWIDIGRLSDYWQVLQRVLRGEIAQMEMPGKQVRPGVWVGLNTSVDWDSVQIEGPIYIGSSTRIEAGARVIGPAWIGHGCHLRAGCTVERSVLFEYTRIGAAQMVSERIMSPQYCVDRHGNTLYVGDEDAPMVWGDARG